MVFATDFTRKTKISLKGAPSTADKRAETKLRLAIEHSNRTLSASPGAATCSIIDLLLDGYDYTGTIACMRFDMIAKPVYTAVTNALRSSLAMGAWDFNEIDRVRGRPVVSSRVRRRPHQHRRLRRGRGDDGIGVWHI